MGGEVRADVLVEDVRIEVGIVHVFARHGEGHRQFPLACEVCAQGVGVLAQLDLRPRSDLARHGDDTLLEPFDAEQVVRHLHRTVPRVCGAAPPHGRARERPVALDVVDDGAEAAIRVGPLDAHAEPPPEDFDLIVRHSGIKP